MARTTTGKRLRFEIFKRDGFRCVYCGATPVQSVLRVDHVEPVAGGGETDPSNLVTACFGCNAGKSDVNLTDKRLPSNTPTEEQRDHVEQIREYLRLQKEITAAKREVVDSIARFWEENVAPLSQELYGRLPSILENHPYQNVIDATTIVGRKFSGPLTTFSPRGARNHMRYFYGVLRAMKSERS